MGLAGHNIETLKTEEGFIARKPSDGETVLRFGMTTKGNSNDERKGEKLASHKGRSILGDSGDFPKDPPLNGAIVGHSQRQKDLKAHLGNY